MHLDISDLKKVPEFCTLLEEMAALRKEVTQLRARHTLQWLTDGQAQEITGLSRRTLLRERQKPDTVIIYKKDHGVRYQYDSLLAHNERRAIGRGRLAQFIAQ